ncbi:MAG: hypothetical protein WAX67_12880 [Rugosibacter sp.]
MVKVNTKIVLLVIFAAACFSVAGFSAGRIVESASAASFLDYFFTPLTTLAAAFGGSWYAFRLHEDNTKKEAVEKDVKAANNAIFELARWYNKFHAFKNQFILEHASNPFRHLYILPAAGMSFGCPKFDYDSLSFIFKSKNPNLLGTLSLVEQEITSTLDVIQQRSKLHVEVLQPAVEEVGKKLGSAFPPSELEKELGARQSQVIKMLTDYMVSGIDDSLAGIREHIDLIKAETTTLYPSHLVVGMINPPSVTAAANP